MDIPVDAKIVLSKDLSEFEGWKDALGDPSTSSGGQGTEQGARQINPDILKCVIQDEQGNYYRIIPMEYKFLMKHGLPLPRKHWLERMKENFKIS